MSYSLSTSVLFILTAIVIIGVYAIFVVATSQRKKRARALRSLYVSDQQSATADEEFSEFEKLGRELAGLFGVNIEAHRKKYYTEYGRAGLHTDAAVSKFLLVRGIIQTLGLSIGAALLFISLTREGDLFSLDNVFYLLFGFVFMMIGISGHSILLDKKAAGRRQKLVDDFPDAVDLLLICIEAGMGLDSALARVSRELQHTHPTVTMELERTRLELGLYGDRVQALQNFAERTDIQSYRSLVSALVQTEKYGTNLAATLRSLSKEYRAARLLKAEEKAARVGALLTLPVVLFVFFPVMVLIMSPPFIQLFASGGLFGR